MKTFHKAFSLFSVLVALVFFSCSKSNPDPTPTPTPPSSDYINCKVDGVTYNSLVVTGIKTPSTFLLNSGNGIGSVSIALEGVTGTGTYQVDKNTSSRLIYTVQSDGTTYNTANCTGAIGTVIVTSITPNKIMGTFNFIGKKQVCTTEVKTITDGSFSVSYHQ